jgi:tetratricopeptide (TPR) repeat protein
LSLSIVLALMLVQAQRPGDDRVVEPSELARDPKLIGREVVVDDRVRYFQPGPRGPRGQSTLDELLLKRTDVIFKLPPGLRPEHPPREPAARVTGVMRSDPRGLYCDVTRLEMKPNDLDRLEFEVKRLDPGDSAARSNWATWAERRARDFGDDKLAARARAIETEALLIDVDRPKADDLALSRRARNHGIDDLANALAHRVLRVRLESAKTTDDLTRLAAEVVSLLPKSALPWPLGGYEALVDRMKTNPIVVYRNAPETDRAVLDRALLAEVIQRRLERRVAEAPAEAMALANEATEKLPDRPEVARGLLNRALTATERQATTMRLSEVETLAKTFRDSGQTERAKTLLKTWLDDQRARLNPSDSEGHVLLATQFVNLLNDRSVAADLLRDALRADPDLKSATEAYRRLGFRKSTSTGEWFDPEAAKPSEPAPKVETAPIAGRGQGDSLRGLSIEQARRQLGSKPDRITRESTQDATIEHWIYQGPPKTRVVVIRRPLGRSRPEVVGDYTIP